jgi:hypothetical protein
MWEGEGPAAPGDATVQRGPPQRAPYIHARQRRDSLAVAHLRVDVRRRGESKASMQVGEPDGR